MNKTPSWALELYRSARIHAARRNIPFHLLPAEFAELVHNSSGRCALTGIPFDFAPVGHGKKRPFAASLDRVESKGPYQIGNVRLVCVAVNVALNHWGDDVLMRIAKGLLGVLSPEEAAFRNRPAGTRLPGVVRRVRGRAGVARYTAWGKGKPPVYLGSFATEWEAFTRARDFNLRRLSSPKAVTNAENGISH